MHNVISSCVFPSGALGAQGERWWGGVGGCGDCRRGGRGEGKGDIFSPSFSFSPSPSVNFLFIYFFFLLYFADCVGTFGKARSKIFGVYVSDTFIVCVCVCVHLCMCLCVYILYACVYWWHVNGEVGVLYFSFALPRCSELLLCK